MPSPHRWQYQRARRLYPVRRAAEHSTAGKLTRGQAWGIWRAEAQGGALHALFPLDGDQTQYHVSVSAWPLIRPGRKKKEKKKKSRSGSRPRGSEPWRAIHSRRTKAPRPQAGRRDLQMSPSDIAHAVCSASRPSPLPFFVYDRASTTPMKKPTSQASKQIKVLR